MTIYKKVKWVLGILMVFVLILTTNLVDRNNFSRVNDSVISIYEDRLLAFDIIFEIFKQLKKKELAIKVSDTTLFLDKNEAINKTIDNFIIRFRTTKTTFEEDIVFNNLKNNIETVKRFENDYIKSNFDDKTNLEDTLEKIDKILDDLSNIQIMEGRRQMSVSKKALSTVEFFTQIEIYLLIFLAIVIQIIVMYKQKQ